MRPIHAVGWRNIRLVAGAAYIAYWLVRIAEHGVPTGRETLSKMVVYGLAITVLGRGWKKLVWVVVDWWPFTAVLIIYDKSRMIADSTGMPLHMVDVANLEQDLFFGHVPTVLLQHWFYQAGHVHWYDAVATLCYTSHFVVTPMLAGIFWFRTRLVFYRYISRVILLSFAGLATYVLFPEAPPWMASQYGDIGEVHRLSALGWSFLHAGFAQRALESGQNGGSNPVAAMPSLHFAFSLLAATFIYGQLRSKHRRLIFIYPAVMALSLVYTGEHYVVDEIAGALYVLGIHMIVSRAERRIAALDLVRRFEALVKRETSVAEVNTDTALATAGGADA